MLTLYCPEILLGPKAGRDLEKAMKDGQKEDDLARTGRARSDPLKMTPRDPKTRAPRLTCCSCSVRKLTSCFRLPPIHWGFRSPAPPTNSLAPGIRWAAAPASKGTEISTSLIYSPPLALRVVLARKVPEALAFCPLALLGRSSGEDLRCRKQLEYPDTPLGCCLVHIERTDRGLQTQGP